MKKGLEKGTKSFKWWELKIDKVKLKIVKAITSYLSQNVCAFLPTLYECAVISGHIKVNIKV